MKYLLILQLLLSIGYAQRVQLFTRTDDIFTSSNHFTLENRKVIFWEDEVVLMTVPIKDLVEVRYAEKSYHSLGTPFTFIGALSMAASLGASVSGQMTNELMLYGVGGGITIYLLGKTLNLIGARFGRDIVYQDFDRLDFDTQKLVLESIGLDMRKRDKQSEFMYGSEGRRTRLLFFTWEGRNILKKKYKPKRKIVRFSFF